MNSRRIACLCFTIICLLGVEILAAGDPGFVSEDDHDEDLFFTHVGENFKQNQLAIKQLVRYIPDLEWMKPLAMGNHRLNDSSQSNQSQSEQCHTDLLNLAESLGSNWTFSLIDSFGKIPSGIARGAFFWTGDFDQCRSVQGPQTDLFPSGLKGKYCLLQVSPKQAPLTINTAICVPDSCNSDIFNADLQQLDAFLKKIPIVGDLVSKFPVVTVSCPPDDVSLSPAAIGCIFVLAVFASLVLIGTGYEAMDNFYKTTDALPTTVTLSGDAKSHKTATSDDQLDQKENSENASLENDKVTLVKISKGRRSVVGEFFLCFSAIKNTRSILDTSDRPGQLNCLHGIRFISITWVILGHVYVFGMAQFANVVDMLKLFNTWSFQAVSNATFSVDTFFLLSGFLLTYMFLKDRSAFTVKKLGSFYLHRYIRLTPVYMAVLLVFGTLFPFLGDGPFWKYADQQTNFCTQHWWKNILYINNFAPVLQMCMGWSWYLSNDMQFFIISPLFLVLLKSSRRKIQYIGLSIVSTLLIASWIATGVVSKVNNLPIMFQGLGDAQNPGLAQEQQYHEFDLIYDKPYTRIGPYLIGCLIGYAFLQLNGARGFFRYKWVILGWSSAVALALTDVYGLYNANISLTTAAFYTTFARSAWALIVGWVIFACLTGHGGPVDTFLSWKLWHPLSRLTYCAYLTHPLVMYYYYQTLRTTLYITNVGAAIHMLSFVVLTYGVAFITTLMFEAPIMKLEKYFKHEFSRK